MKNTFKQATIEVLPNRYLIWLFGFLCGGFFAILLDYILPKLRWL